MNNLTEKQIEDVFELYHSDLIEEGLTLLSRQHIFDNRLRADLIFKDRKDTTVLVELKRSAISREDIGQLVEYHGMFESPKTRIILVAPFIPEAVRKSFEHFGIEYIQFSKTKIEKLYKSIENKTPTELEKIETVEPKTILTHPLTNKVIEGNIAFKIVYNDNEWMNTCSKDIAEYNFKHRTWCKIQSEFEYNCQHPKWKEEIENDSNSPCYDCTSLRYLQFSPGHFHGPKHDNEAKRCLGAKMGKIALFTSREPGAQESERFVFAIGQINRFEVNPDTNTEIISCDVENAVYIKNNDFKLWKYFRNKNTDKIAWNTGLFRYINDDVIRELLKEIITDNKLDKLEIENARKLIEYV